VVSIQSLVIFRGILMLEEYKDEFDIVIEDGLLLLGWQDSVRLTTEDRSMVHPICEKAIDLKKKNILTPEIIDELSLKAYDIILFQVAGKQERADYISLVYYNSQKLRPLMNLIDESTICFYKGYYTAALSLSFIILERYLRSVSNWSPGDRDPSFFQLKQSVLSLPNEDASKMAHKIINIIYSRYESLNPTQFEFNRHGLLHGVRGPTKYDEMNCARIYQLFNLLCEAEEVGRTGYGEPLEFFKKRYSIYENCNQNEFESIILNVNWKSE
jgi:hypothetical protein